MGKGARPDVVNRRIETAFAALTVAGYAVTSPTDDEYNCIAWAVGEQDNWWWPDMLRVAYWPAGIVREETIEAFIAAFGTVGFEVCDNAELEAGYEKIALFTDARGLPTHAAKLLPSGIWASKLGNWEDITHNALDGVSGRLYGNPVQFLRRPVSLPSA